MNQRLKEVYARGQKSANAYILRRIYGCSIALVIVCPLLALVEFFQQFKVHESVADIQSAYWFMLVMAFTTSVCAYLVARYSRRADTTAKQWVCGVAFVAVFLFGLVGFALVGSLR